MWFAEVGARQIGRITPNGSITEFPVPDSGAGGPTELATGPDGNVWFVEPGPSQFGRITAQGVVTIFPLPMPDVKPNGITTSLSTPTDIALGPDGNLWFTENLSNKIGRVSGFGPEPTPTPTAACLPPQTPGPSPVPSFTGDGIWQSELATVNNGGVVYDNELAGWAADALAPGGVIHARDAAFFFQECSGGGMLDEIRDRLSGSVPWVGASPPAGISHRTTRSATVPMPAATTPIGPSPSPPSCG